jgi:hypothetical protein
LTAADPANDVIPIVDVSDTSMAASGTTKKISVNNILGASGTATLASATITGDLTVDTSTLKVDSTNNRVGIGTASPAYPLSVAGRISYSSGIGEGADLTVSSSSTTLQFGLGSSWAQQLYYLAGVEALRLNTTANLVLKGGTTTANGVGVTFPATQVASSDANCLDDYVESTFSPTIVGSTLAGTATYSLQTGRATKVGRLVTFSLRVTYTVGLGTGNLRVGNLPFTAGVGSNFSIYAENIALTAGYYPVASISSGNTYIGIDQLPTGGGAAAAVPYDVAGDIQISGSYIV